MDNPNDPYKRLYDVDDGTCIDMLMDIRRVDFSFRVYNHHSCRLVRMSRSIRFSSLNLFYRYHTPAPAALVIGQLPPFSVATLINGKGRYTGGPAVPLSVINVQQSKRYRFRIVAMACDPAFTFSIDQHKMTIIEADGEYTVPHVVDSLQIFAAQRYSVVIIADQPVSNYWIRADPNRGDSGFAGGINAAVFRYEGAPESEPSTDPTTVPPSLLPLKETDLHALESPRVPGKPVPGGADVVLNIAHAFDFTTFQYKMNGVPWVPPTVPILLQILSGAQAAQDLLPSGSVYSLPPNKVIELSLPGTGVNQGGPVRNQE